MTIPIANDVWRKYNTANIPASGAHAPDKTEIMAWGTNLEAALGSSGSGYYANLALLNADLLHADKASAIVYNDGTPANNGVYAKSGASGAGSWIRVGDLAGSVVLLTVTGGTGNAIVATAPETPTMPGKKLFLLVPTTTNTLATTLAYNTVSAAPIKNALGLDLVANSLISNSPVLMIWSVDHWQLLLTAGVDANSVLAAVLAAATAASGSATNAASSASALANQVHQYDTLALAIAATIPGGVNELQIFGRGAVADCPVFRAKRLGSTPGTPRTWHFQNTVDSVWWIMTQSAVVSPAQFSTSTTITAIQDALDFQQAFGVTGGIVRLEPNKTYTGTTAPKVWNGLELDGQWSTIVPTLSGSGAYGLRVGTAVLRNVYVTAVDAGVSDSQGVFGAGIALGVCNGSAGNLIGTPDYFASSRPRLYNVFASTTRAGYPAIQIMGDVDYWIEGGGVPDSATCTGIHADWSDIGGATVTGLTSGDLNRLTRWRAAFDAGTMITTHPRGTIRNFRVGKLTTAASGDTGSRIVRLSACYDTIIEDCVGAELTQPSVEIIGGDFGFEFAPPEVKRRAYRNIRVRNIVADKCHGFGLFVDTNGDNLGNAIALGYSALTVPIANGDIIVDGINITGTYSNSDTNDGIRISACKGLTIISPKVEGFQTGIAIEGPADDVTVKSGRVFSNRASGITTRNDTTINNVTFEDVKIYGNGTNVANSGGFSLSGGNDVKVLRCVIGVAGEATQFFGVQFNTSSVAVRASVIGNVVREVATGGVGFAYANSSSDILWVARDNVYLGSAGTAQSGQSVVPIERTPRPGGGVHTRCISAAGPMSAGVTPTGAIAATLLQGDLVEIVDAVSGAPAISRKGVSVWSGLVNVP